VNHLPITYALQDAAFSLSAEEPDLRPAPPPEPKRSIFSFFRPRNWEPLCPDLEREINLGQSRRHG